MTSTNQKLSKPFTNEDNFDFNFEDFAFNFLRILFYAYL